MIYKFSLDTYSNISSLNTLLEYIEKKIISYINVSKVNDSYVIQYNLTDTEINDKSLFKIYDILIDFRKNFIVNNLSDFYLLYEYDTNTFLVNIFLIENNSENNETITAIQYLNNCKVLFDELNISNLDSNLYTKDTLKKNKFLNKTYSEVINLIIDKISQI